MSDSTEERILNGDVLKVLYYKDAFSERTQLGSHLLWVYINEAGYHKKGKPLSRERLERVVDRLAAKGYVEKLAPSPTGRLLTDYEAFLTRKGRGFLEGALSEDPDVLIGDL
ncbi:MAG: hypothetical protein HY618_00965 [Candidatus Tectomicrobia bacterium]|uniref:Uncharacterized protein n=1 Tax=Tectimicrobiota bacterium TaxID=2528274 RepID=A0A933E8X5_UNCTE|nr:hypothetical protein [Candidatus Tectomicrobia bacterium]